MTNERESGGHILLVLIGGFALLVLLLLASGFVAIDSMRSIESEAERIVGEQQATIGLIDEIQSEEGSLSRVFYALAAGREDVPRTELLQRLDHLEAALRRTTDVGLASHDSILWDKVKKSAEAFILEGRDTIRSNRPVTETLYRRHENLLDAIAELASSSVNARGAMERREAEYASSHVRDAVILLGIGLLVATGGATFTIWSVVVIVRRLRWQAAELAHLSSRAMSEQEDTARRFSREMHDHFGQTLNAIEANLVAMKHTRMFQMERIEDCMSLLKDAVGNVREVSQLLRPSILDDFGLDASLHWLVDGFAERTGIDASYTCTFTERLDDELETQLFRISQEALTNIARHSGATVVRFELKTTGSRLRLVISDNGKGLPADTSGSGLGLVGMRARARAAGGLLKMDSRPGNGLKITVELPLEQPIHAPQNSNPAR